MKLFCFILRGIDGKQLKISSLKNINKNDLKKVIIYVNSIAKC